MSTAIFMLISYKNCIWQEELNYDKLTYHDDLSILQFAI